MEGARRPFFRFFGRWEWLGYGLLLPLLLFPTGWRALALLGLPVLWGMRAAGTGRFFPRTALNSAILVMALTLLVSLYATFDMALSFPKIAGLVLGMALFFTAVSHAEQHKHGLWHVTAFVLAAGLGMILIGAASLRWSGPLAVLAPLTAVLPNALTNLPGADSGVNANQLAGVISWVLPLALALLLGLWRALPARRWLLLFPFLLAISGVSLVALAGSQSRGGLVGVFLSAVLMLALAGKWGRWLAATAVALAILALVITPLGSSLIGATAVSEGADFGLGGRLEIWSRAVYGLQDFPFTGVSMNGFRRVVHILYPLFMVSPDTDIAHAHNHLLQAGLDLGIPGLIAYLALWLLAGWLVWASWRRAGTAAQRALAVGLAGALAGGWFFGVLDAIALGARPGFLWWLLLALVVSLHRQVHEPQPI